MRKILFPILALIVMLFNLPDRAFAQGACSVSISIAASATGSSACFVPSNTKSHVVFTGTWVGTVRVQASQDGGSTWVTEEETTANGTFKLEPKPYDRRIRGYFHSRTSGTLTGSVIYNAVSGDARFRYETIPLGSVAYSSLGISVIGSATSAGMAELMVEEDFLSTGAGVLIGGTGGTDNVIFALYDSSGGLVANTTTSGTTAGSSNTIQEIAWSSGPVRLTAGRYFLVFWVNGTTATFRRTAASTFVAIRTASLTSQTFGTVPGAIVTPTTLETSVAAGGTNTVGPIGYVY